MIGGGEEKNLGAVPRRRIPKLKNPKKIWKNRRAHNPHEEAVSGVVEEEEQQQEEQLEEVSRRLIIREEELFSGTEQEEQEEDRLQEDLKTLRLNMWRAIQNTFTSCDGGGHLQDLRSTMTSIQQQENQDRRWKDCLQDCVPVWRPLKCLSTHNGLIQNLVESRMSEAAEDESGGTEKLSSPIKRQVCQLGKRVKEDLLTVMRSVKDCYPPHMDILNLYAGLYHWSFSTRLTLLAAAGLQDEDCSYLLFWINHCYPREVLGHQELDGQIKTACLGYLLLPEDLNRLEEQYLTHKETEEKTCISGSTPELIDGYFFSPLAVDVIQVMRGVLTEFSCTIKDQRKCQRITAHLESFLCRYRKCVEDFVKGNHSNLSSLIKAQLVCEEQLRDYITAQSGSLNEEQRRRCLDSLSALRNCGYRCLSGQLQSQMKLCLSPLWTPAWMDGSLPVINQLLDSLDKHLDELMDLKPTCRQSLLCALHEDIVLEYVRRMMMSRMKNRDQQVSSAQRMDEDAEKIQQFFSEICRDSSWLHVIMTSLAEVLRLNDSATVQLEIVSLVHRVPDLSPAHLSALLSLKIGLSAPDIRSIRSSVEENRPLDVSTNHSPPFFSKIKITWLSNKISQMSLKTGKR
ncbi:tumor necrosis factor alpha-induced protein 2a isoform 2-T2 [Pholidichthys leucotaenia]